MDSSYHSLRPGSLPCAVGRPVDDHTPSEDRLRAEQLQVGVVADPLNLALGGQQAVLAAQVTRLTDRPKTTAADGTKRCEAWGL